MNNSEEDFKEFLRMYKKAKNNAVYFLEHYYNVVHPDKKILLTDEEKQELFDKYKGIPLLRDMNDWNTLNEAEKRKKEKGLKDWEYED